MQSASGLEATEFVFRWVVYRFLFHPLIFLGISSLSQPPFPVPHSSSSGYSVVSRCSQVDLGKEAAASQISYTDGEEQGPREVQLMVHPCSGAPEQQQCWFGPAQVQAVAQRHTRGHSATYGGESGDSQSQVPACLW